MQKLMTKVPDFFHQVRKGLTIVTKMNEANKMQDKFWEQPFSHATDAVVFKAVLRGKANYESLICDFEQEIKTDKSALAVVNSDTSTEYYSQEIDSFTVMAHKEYLQDILPENAKTQKLFEFFESKANIKILNNKTINSKTKIITQNILNNGYNKDLSHLFLESAVLEILYTEFDNFFNHKTKSLDLKLSKAELDALHYAKEILEQSISNPPSISELSRMVGLNEFKLKVGFNKIYNLSPYRVSIANRLLLAKKLLEQSELNINEIATKVGYSTASNFSNAFFKHFKIRPMDLMKKRKYYY